MDLDIEMDVDLDITQDIQQIPEAYTHDIITGEEQEPGEVDEPVGGDDATDGTLVPNKVHIRGLDTFTPDDVKAFLAQHNGSGQFERIEWIDDSSANLLFRSESAAQEALVSLAALAIADTSQLPPLELLPAKSYAAKPDSILQVRFAVTSDKKVIGAAQRSRFYLLHPEYDPEERRRRGEFGRGKYRDRDDRYGRDRRDRRDRRRQDEEDEEPFDVNLYGDDPAAVAQRALGSRQRSHSRSRRNSASSASGDSDRGRGRLSSGRNRNKELFPDRRGGGGYRARSASPVRDRDGDAEMADEAARRADAERFREKNRSINERASRDTKDSRPRELFPEKRNNSVKELFPLKASSGPTGRAQMDQVDDTSILPSAKLADRITRPGSSGGFNIRGLATKRASDQGIAIKGTGPTVKELFPDKFNNNAGKELFVERLEGRNRRRQRAEDLFH
ncbi:hypothetical protein OQA88_13592 [Cercophora sp. LCS_1]